MSRFAVDARAAVEEPAGRGRVVRELLRAFAARDDDHVFDLYARVAWDEPLDERFRWRLIAAPDPLWNLRAARAANAAAADAFLSTNSYLTAWFLRIPAVVVVYDLVAFQPGITARRSSGLIERATIGRAVRQAGAHGGGLPGSARSRQPVVDRRQSLGHRLRRVAAHQLGRVLDPLGR